MMSTAELFQQATGHHQRGELERAETLYREVLATDGRHADATHLLALVLTQRKAYDEALQLLQQAVALSANNAVFHHNLGEARRRTGDLQGALVSFDRAVTLQPRFAEPHFCAGNVLKQLDRPQQAIAAYREAIRAEPRHHRAMFNLANILREQGHVDDSIAVYRDTLQLAPNFVDAVVNLACAYKEQGDSIQALSTYETARTLQPDRPDLRQSIAQCYESLGQFERAAGLLREELAERPNWALEFRLATFVRPFAEGRDAMAADRTRVEAAVRDRSGNLPKLSIEEMHSGGIEPPMALANQGADERPLKEQYAKLFAPLFPQWEAPGSGQSRRHVGIVTTHGHEGVFLKCMRGLIERLPRERFRVTVACSPLGRNFFRQQVQNPDVDYFVLPGRIGQAAGALRSMRFDVLLYWEIGTDSTNYFLPFYRLAPVQCTTFGWPVTSGIPTVDYFLSSAELETPDSDQYFSERLIRLPTLPTYYYHLELPPPTKKRADFGLLEKAHVYFCGQRLRKFHPDFDDLIAGILRTDAAGLFVCIGDKQPFMAESFRKRFATHYPDVADRVRIVPWLEFADYLQLTALTDVVLDTPHYGGGANTVYDAVAAGRPIVTLPGRFQRGRYAMAVNRRLEVDECNAASPDDYVRRATQIVGERDMVADVSRRIAQRRHVLFEDHRYIEALQDFFSRSGYA